MLLVVLLPQSGKKPLRKANLSFIIKFGIIVVNSHRIELPQISFHICSCRPGRGSSRPIFLTSRKEHTVSILVRQGRLVDPVGGIGGIMDILIEDGKIAVIGSDLSSSDAQVLDAHGLIVCAGLVDLHAHLGEPAGGDAVNVGAKAAAAGGFTSVACMPDLPDILDTPGEVKALTVRAGMAQRTGARVWPVAAVSEGRRGYAVNDYAALKKAGAVALCDASPIRNANLMRDAMILAHRQGLTLLACCEDADLCQDFAVNEGRISRRLRIPGRPAIAEELQVMREVMLAEETGAAIHICHVSTAKAVAIIRRYKRKGVRVTCGTCPQYFTFTEDEVLTQGATARVCPPLRTAADVEGIIEGLKDGTIDVIASGHVPRSQEETALPLAKAPGGIASLETAFAATLTALYHTGEMRPSDILRKMTTNPAWILRLPNMGRLAVGSEADLILFDPNEQWTVEPEKFVSSAHNTPFTGRTLIGKIKCTLVGGEIVYPSKE